MSYSSQAFLAERNPLGALELGVPSNFEQFASQVEAFIQQLKADAETETNDPAFASLAAGRLKAARALKKTFDAAHAKYDEGVRLHAASLAAARAAWAARAQGTLDAAQALVLDHNVVAALAAERARSAQAGDLRTVADRAANALRALMTGREAKARDEAVRAFRAIADGLTNLQLAYVRDTHGRSYDAAAHAAPAEQAFWPLAEKLAREHFKATCAAERSNASPAYREFMRVEHFDECVANYKRGFETRQASARNRLASMQSQIETLSPASMEKL